MGAVLPHQDTIHKYAERSKIEISDVWCQHVLRLWSRARLAYAIQ
jgi:hypothetical protein